MNQLLKGSILAFSAILLLYGMDFCVHLLNEASNASVVSGLLGLTVLLFVIYRICSEYRARFLQVITIVGVAALSFTSTGCYKIIEPGHAGIVVQQTGSNRGVDQIPVSTGRVFYNPVNEDVLDYPTYVQRAIWTASTTEGKATNEEIAFQSSDQLHFTADVAVSYQLVHNRVPAFYVQFRNDDIQAFTHGFFRDALRKAIGQAASHFSQEEVNGGKQSEIEKQAQENLAIAVAPYGVQIIQLAFTSPPRPPAAVQQAIQNKIAAIQRAEQIENEKRQAVAEGAKNVAFAEAQAKANQTITSSITPTLLEWERLKVLQNKWDGKMPMVTSGNNSLLLTLPK